MSSVNKDTINSIVNAYNLYENLSKKKGKADDIKISKLYLLKANKGSPKHVVI